MVHIIETLVILIAMSSGVSFETQTPKFKSNILKFKIYRLTLERQVTHFDNLGYHIEAGWSMSD